MNHIITSILAILFAGSVFAEHVFPPNPDPDRVAFFGQLGRDNVVVTNPVPASAEEVGALPAEGGEMSGNIGMGGNGIYDAGFIQAEGSIETAGDITAGGSALIGGEVSVGLDLKTKKDLYANGDALIDGDVNVGGGLSAGTSTIGQVGLENGDVSYIYNGMYRNLTDLHAAVGGKLDIEKAAGYWSGSKTYAKFDIVTRVNSSNVYVSLADGNAGHEPTASSTWWRSFTSLVDAAKFVNGSKIDSGIAEAKSYTDDATNGVDRTKLVSPDGNSYQTSDGGFYEKTGATPYYELLLASSGMTYRFDVDTSDGIYYCENFEGGIRARLRFVGGYWSLDGFLNGYWDNIASTSGTGDDPTIVMAGGVFTFTRKVGPGGFVKTKQVAYTDDIPDFPANSLVLTNGVVKTTDGGSVSASAIGAAPQSTTYTKTETDALIAASSVEIEDVPSNVVWRLEAESGRFFFKPVRPINMED